MRGEFHIHTVFSDGLLTYTEIMDYLSNKVDYFSITDHDYIDGSIKAYQECDNYNLKAIIGVEISTTLNDESIHVLGYFKDEVGLEPLRDKLKKIADERIDRLYIIKQKLKDYFNIELDVSNLLKKNSITRGSIAKEIIKQGYDYTMEELFAKVLGKDCKAYHPSSKVSTIEAVNLIHQLKGLAVLAHPVLIKKNKIEDVLKIPFDGIEAIYPLNTDKDEQKFKDIAINNNMLITAGNDFHYFGDLMHADLLTKKLEGKDLEKFIRKINELK